MPTSVNCPTCGKTVPWSPESHWRPFCSKRCRLIDIGDWLDETHRIPGDPNIDDPSTENDTPEPLLH